MAVLFLCSLFLKKNVDDLPIDESGVLRTSTINALRLICCLMKLGAPKFGASMFKVIMPSWWMIPLICLKRLFYLFWWVLAWNLFSWLLNRNSYLFPGSFCLKTPCPSFHSNLVFIFVEKVYFSEAAKWIPGFLIFSTTVLCLLIGKLRYSMFKDIIDCVCVCVLICVILSMLWYLFS